MPVARAANSLKSPESGGSVLAPQGMDLVEIAKLVKFAVFIDDKF
jgi:hypothetical protein